MIRYSVIFLTWFIFLGGSVTIENSVNAEEAGPTELENNNNPELQEMTAEQFKSFIAQDLLASLIVDCFDGSPKKYAMHYYYDVDKNAIYMNTKPYGERIQHLCEKSDAPAQFIIGGKTKGIQINGTVTEERKDTKNLTTKIYERYMFITSPIRKIIEERPVVFKLTLTPKNIQSWTTPQE